MKLDSFLDKPLALSGSKVAIVGSSSDILSKESGAIIDSHDHVVRFNLAPIKGYEKHVGSKEDIRAINDGQYHHFKGVNNIHNSRIIFNNPKGINYGPTRDRHLHESSSVFVLNPGKIHLLKSFCGFKSGKIPSTGVTLIMLFVASGYTPTIFGFDTEFKPYQHYWEDKAIPTGDVTDVKYEKSLLREMLAKQMIVQG